MTSSVLPNPNASKRGRIAARDGLIFLTLCSISVALFVVTLLLFRSLQRHQEALGRRLVTRGRSAMQNGDPADAVVALRSALTYTDDLPTQVLLAQALAGAGRTEEAANYFLNLRETRPGDGFLNLQLARLYRRERDVPYAVDSYRASIFGDWKGDGAMRRREVRLELSDYLAEQNQASAARDELLVAAGNAPDTLTYALLFGDRFQALGDTQDAVRLYNKALRLDPHNLKALVGAGRDAYTLGNYDIAAKLLTSALDTSQPANGKAAHGNAPSLSQPERDQLKTLAANARRLPELDLSRNLPAAVRADHILLASQIAQARLNACMIEVSGPAPQGAPAGAAKTPVAAVPVPPASPFSPALQALHSEWHTVTPRLKQRTLAHDALLQDDLTRLVSDTETQTATACGTPHGDDALLLMRANAANHP